MERLKICLRIKPILSDENNKELLMQVGKRNILIVNDKKTFNGTFDKIFPNNSTQKDIFTYIKKTFTSIQKGNNCTIITYGSKNSGKTFTMLGQGFCPSNNILKNNYQNLNIFSDKNGLLPNFIMELFNIYNKKISNEVEISCSYVHIYNDKIYDLLTKDKNKKIKIKHDIISGVTVEGVNEIKVDNFYSLFELLSTGNENLFNKKNEVYSHSHNIFVIYILDKEMNKKIKIKFCDLASANNLENEEENMKIHQNINISLTCLRNVLYDIHKKNSYIPYKDSKLTQILQDTLSEKTYLIANISSEVKDFEETLYTLHFLHKLQELKNSNKLEEITSDKLDTHDTNDTNTNNKILMLQKEVAELRSMIEKKEKKEKNSNFSEKDEISELQKENEELKKIIKSKSLKSNRINDLKVQELLKENILLKKEINNLTNNINININTNENNFKSLINRPLSKSKKNVSRKNLSNSKPKIKLFDNIINSTRNTLFTDKSYNKTKLKTNEINPIYQTSSKPKNNKENIFRNNARRILRNQARNNLLSNCLTERASIDAARDVNNNPKEEEIKKIKTKKSKPIIIKTNEINENSNNKLKLLEPVALTEGNEIKRHLTQINDINENDEKKNLNATEIDNQNQDSSNKFVLAKEKTKTETNDSDTTQKICITTDEGLDSPRLINLIDRRENNIHNSCNNIPPLNLYSSIIQTNKHKKLRLLDDVSKKNKIKTMNFIKGLKYGQNMDLINNLENLGGSSDKGFSLINMNNL